MKWQTIDTAPKDGTDILLALPWGIRIGAWEPHADFSYPFAWKAQNGNVLVREWKEDEPPTHWMPLPAPPTNRAE